ncbi:restriction endonuclease S subunit [Mycobacteroides abscessus subsp. bolletii]|nr:restriction endonuclease S subunit [Mycobacteroides abscessus subsp. bolletii]
MSTVQLRHVATLVTGSTPPGSLGDEAYDSMGLSWIRPNDLLEANIPVDSSKHLSESGEAYSRIINQPACVLVGIGSIGKLGFALPPFATNQQIVSIIPKTGWDMKYLYYVLKNSEQWLKANANGTTLPILNTNDLGRLPVPLKSFEQQKRIANELDYELTKIDQLIADQLYLQELLAERLTSLTFELATDASNSDRYETGDPFWKTLPKGWTLQKLGWHFKIGNGSTPKSDNPEYWTDNADNGFPWFNSSVVNNEVAGTPSRYVTTKALNECHLPFVPQGSLLVGLTGQGKTRGMVTKTGIDSTINQHVAYLHAYKTSDLNIDFVKLCLQATYPMLRFISDGNGSTKGALTCDSLNHFSLPVPPVNHQRKSINLFKNQQITNNSLMKSSAELINILEEVKNPRTKLVEI